MKSIKKKSRNRAYKKSLAFFTENDGIFDQQMKNVAEQIILGLAAKLDDPKKGQVAELLGLQRNRLTRLLNGLGIDQKFKTIVSEKRLEKRKIRYDVNIG